jgi:hypothetical protein
MDESSVASLCVHRRQVGDSHRIRFGMVAPTLLVLLWQDAAFVLGFAISSGCRDHAW